MYLDSGVVDFLPNYANSQTQWKIGGAANDKSDELSPTRNPSLIFTHLQTIQHLPASDNKTFHAQLSAH